jgi:ribosomal protein S18 acetylase RimI-like enzyme
MPDLTAAARPDATALVIRPATTRDIPHLLRIESDSFATDRLTRRSFQHLLTRGRARCLVALAEDRLVGYGLVLFHSGTSLARLYSFAIDPACRGLGVGRRLLSAIEAAAREGGCGYLRMEVRRDNEAALVLYQRHGYREFGVYADYYEDHMAALRLEKPLAPGTGAGQPAGARTVPYYRQTLDFTCGPAALMMAMKALDAAVELSRQLELRLWRESTTIFMTSGHGGCGPHGLALAAWRRGFAVELFLNDEGTPFLDSVRSEEKKEVMRLVHEDFTAIIAGTDIAVHCRPLAPSDLAAAVEDGGIPIVLISSYRIYREKFPHWIVVTGTDDTFIYAHDPLVSGPHHQSDFDRIHMPIPKKDFEHMARYGKAQLRASLILRARPGG